MIKHLLIWIMILLLLAGCATDVPEATVVPSTVAIQETEPPATESRLNVLNITAEDGTCDAVQIYSLGEMDCTGILVMGEDILLFTREPGACLTRLTGENGKAVAKISLAGDVTPYNGAFRVMDRKIGYYEGSTRSIVFLDGMLAETSRLELPESMVGTPVLSPNMDTVYYCTEQEIRAMDIKTGMSRLVRRQSGLSQAKLQCCFDGEILSCVVTETDGERYTCFLSSQTGEILGKDPNLWSMETYSDLYFLQRNDGIITERLFGTIDGTIQSLNLAEGENIVPALIMDGIITTSIKEGSLELSFYDLSTGNRTAKADLPGMETPYAYAVGKEAVWFLSYDGTSAQSLLYRWDVSQSKVEDDMVYSGPRYTLESPDLEGLAECQRMADEIGQKFGVEILITDAALEQSCGYALELEYQVNAIWDALMDLEGALSQYPEDFFQIACQGTESGVLHICLVRSIANHLTGVQYWPDGDAYIALAVGEKVEQTFYHEACHVLDTYIIAKSQAYDTWEQLNPTGFAYDYGYDLYTERSSDAYLEGENRAFIDSYSMTYPKEDRARIMEYAITANHEELFEAEILQKKLRQICIGIRDAFGLEKDSRTFSWEQYLKEPLAYTGN